ncbi:hypothetical protein, partial [Paenibacillus silvae]
SEPIINRAEEAINFALRKNIKVIYLNGKRVELQNHERYTETKPLGDQHWSEFFSREVTTDEALLAEVNPFHISRIMIVMYLTTPNMRQTIDITTKKGARELIRYCSIAYKMMEKKKIRPAVTCDL